MCSSEIVNACEVLSCQYMVFADRLHGVCKMLCACDETA